MSKADLTVAGAFAGLAAALLIGSALLPAGMGGQPGPGFFPSAVGAAMLGLIGALAVRARSNPAEGRSTPAAGRPGLVVGVLVLTAVYLALWGSGWFALRTAIYLVLLLLLVGQPWRRSVVAAATLAIVVTAAFRIGLRVSLE